MRIASALLGLMLYTIANAAPPLASTLRIDHAWVRWLPAGLPAAGYVVIHNEGKAPQRLASIDSPDYARVMLHRSVQKKGVEQMQMVDGLDIPPHGTATMAPGGYHLMLMQPVHAVKPGDIVRLQLHFVDGETLQANLTVRPANAGS